MLTPAQALLEYRLDDGDANQTRAGKAKGAPVGRAPAIFEAAADEAACDDDDLSGGEDSA
jgi:hypothetical protein